jgi:hypothetical protein
MADLVVGDVLRYIEFAVVLPGKDRAINRAGVFLENDQDRRWPLIENKTDQYSVPTLPSPTPRTSAGCRSLFNKLAVFGRQSLRTIWSMSALPLRPARQSKIRF